MIKSCDRRIAKKERVMTERTQELHVKVVRLAKDFLHTEGEILTVLMEMQQRRSFAELNYANIFDYCERALHLSRAQAYYFKTVAEKSVTVPELKEAIDQGELTLSEARRIVSVITPENSGEWINKAKDLSQVELERAVTEVNPRKHVNEHVRPVAKEVSELKCAIDPKTEENLAVLKDLLSQKLGKAATLSEVIGWTAEVTREKMDPERKARRSSSRKVSSGKQKTGRHAIAAVVKHQVVREQGFQCSFVDENERRCEQKRWLQFHHVKAVANGGLNTPSNLKILCSQHHVATHRNRLVRSP